MIKSKRKYNQRKSIRFLISGIIVAIAFTSLAGLFLFKVPQVRAGIPTTEVASVPSTLKFVWDLTKYLVQNAAAVAYKKGLSYFLNKIAYDSAVYIASGGKGQKPLFITDFGEYMKEVGDGVAGEFLDNLGKSVFGESLCTFTPEVQIKLSVATRRALEPEKAECPLSEIAKNVTRISKMSTSDLVQFQKSWNPEASELGAFLEIMGQVGEEKAKAEAETEMEQTWSTFKGLTSTVTGQIKTPKEVTGGMIDRSLALSTEAETTYTGSPLADALGVFTDTLMNRLMQRIFQKGLLPDEQYQSPSGSAATSGGIAAAKRYATELAMPSFRTTGSLDILNKLSTCSSELRETNNCVIDSDFQAAIEQRLTVREALNQGFLKGDRTFGFDATGQEPEYYNGYPYRSLVILRKYRIIPSSWETAALYIKNYVSPAKNFGLQELVDLYDDEPVEANGYNPFYHLVDPNWVLKAPEAFCQREGPGEQLISDELVRTKDTSGPLDPDTPDGVIDDNDIPTRLVTRMNYCADERTCIDEAEDGSCEFYGYCTEEKPIWKFQGTECEPYENTCQAFVDSNNNAVSYIQNSLNYDSCQGDNADCWWYCENQDQKCSSEDYLASGNKINLDSSAEKCSESNAGCTEYIQIANGTNLVANSSFEFFSGTADDGLVDDYTANYAHWGWINDAMVTEATTRQLYDGTYSVKANGGQMTYWIDMSTPVYKKAFNFTIQARADAACSDIVLEIGGFHDGGAWKNYVNTAQFGPIDLAAGSWQQLSVWALVDTKPTTNENQIGIRFNAPCEIYYDGAKLELNEATNYVNYGASNQLYLQDESINTIFNSSFSIDNGTNYYPAYDESTVFGAEYRNSRIPGNSLADGWIGTAIDNTQGFGDIYSGSGGYQIVAIAPGSSYDLYAWVQPNGSASPITAMCLDSDFNPLTDCHLNASAGDPRTQVTNPGSTNWTWVDIGLQADNSSAAYIKIELNGGSKVDNIGLALSDDSLVCRIDEVGCELYDPAEAGDKVPGVVTGDDYCPAQYDGCKSYEQMPVDNGANSASADRSGVDPIYLIAQSGKQCQAAYLGCEEYTNLDEVALGGEGLEYYTQIRHCLKPDPDQCATFYRWEGDEVRGFELIAESLKEAADGSPETTDGSGDCDPAEPGCLLYYNQAGESSYRMRLKTISCSDDCHPLRNTLDNTIYNAIPAEGIKCPKSQAGCREYRGSTGYNIRKIVEDDFEDGNTSGWEGDITISTESLKAGGLSARCGSLMNYSVNELIETDKTYMVEFWAKAENADSNITAYFDPSAVVFPPETGVTIDNKSWKKIVLGPAQFDQLVDEEEKFVIAGTTPFYIDNIVVWETRDNVYLIYKSYNECPEEWVGCSLYYDRDKNEHYLKSFTRLCRPEKVGCEAMIETQNSSNPFATEVYGQTTAADSVRPVVNKKNNYCQAGAKGCEALGRPSFDLEGRVSGYQTVYLENDPDKYETIVCPKTELFCSNYTYSDQADSYVSFKNPGSQTCTYKLGVNYLSTLYDGWFKQNTEKFCPVQKYTCIGGERAGNVCFGRDSECPGGTCDLYQASPQPTKVCGPQQQEYCRGGLRDGAKCNSLASVDDPVLGCGDGLCSDLTEVCYGGPRAGEPCDSDADPTGSYGCAEVNGQNNGYCAERACQTDDDCTEAITGVAGLTCSEYWVGQCKNEASGCNEYRDPQDPLPSLASDDRICAGGENAGVACSTNADCDSGQCIYQGCNANCRIEYDSQGNFYRLDESCKPYPNDSGEPSLLPGCQPYYYLEQSTDTASCYGIVNQEEGCLLFNDVSSSSGLTYDSDLTYALLEQEKGSPYQCPGEQTCIPDSNKILKVIRDRVCNQWLYCKTSYTVTNSQNKDERLCYKIGNCREMGSNGECSRPIGEGQCDNDPGRACLVDADCQNNGICVEYPDFEHPDPPPEYEERAVTPLPHPLDLTYDYYTEIDQTKNFSGYSKIGMSWRCSDDLNQVCWRDGICEGGDNIGGFCYKDEDCPGSVCADDQCPGEDNICQVIHGYYPIASMPEVGLGVNLPNYNFEYLTPYPWEARGMASNNIVVMLDGLDQSHTNHVLKIAPQGVDTGARVSLDHLIFNDQRYVVSLKLRANREAAVKVQLCYNGDTGPCNSFGEIKPKDYWQVFTLPQDNPIITSGVEGVSYFSIVDPAGESGLEIYVDDIILKPLLEKKSTNNPPEASADERFVNRSCRLYPETTSLSCDYTKASTSDEIVRQYHGWKGYCLERDPLDKKTCLLWWPVDVITGESNIFSGGELSGYLGTAPLYYCAQFSPYEYRRVFWLSGGYCYKANNYDCPVNYYRHKAQQKDLNNWPDKCQYVCIPNGITKREATYCPAEEDCYWDGDTCKGDSKWCGGWNHVGYWAPFDYDLETTHKWDEFGMGYASEVLGLRCELVAQTVAPDSANKAWYSRISGGYSQVWDIGYQLSTDSQPYGSAVPPLEVGGMLIADPTTWDTDYTDVWGDPFTQDPGKELSERKQPLYWLANHGWASGKWNWQGPIDTGFNENEYQQYARAGSPYSCKDRTHYRCNEISDAYYTKEQFGGPVINYPEDPEGGLGLKRLERLFVYAYNIWVWGDGKCSEVEDYRMCGSSNPEYPLQYKSCANEDDCDVDAGVCIGMVCELDGDNDEDYPVFESCGCEEGICSAEKVCSPGFDRYCEEGACTEEDDACLAARCSGGTREGEVCTIDNNCSAGEICTQLGSERKCVDSDHQDCDCPGGTCQLREFCQDTGNICTDDDDCPKHCDINGDGHGELSANQCNNDADCEAVYGVGITCEVVLNNCSVDRWRCSNNPERSCDSGDNCVAGYSCNSSSKCVSSIVSCDCPGSGAFCADGLCDETSALCASNNRPQDYCPGGTNDCMAGWSVCKKSATRCDCDAGETCEFREVCETGGFPLQPCGETVCTNPESDCCQYICEGGGDHETLGKDGKCCDPGVSNSCDGADEQGNPVSGICRAAICSAGVYSGMGCGNDEFCIGADGECENYAGTCTQGTNLGYPCNNNGECGAGGYCAFKMCLGGVLSGNQCDVTKRCKPDNPDDKEYEKFGYDCSLNAGICEPNGYCADVDADIFCNGLTDPEDFDPDHPQYNLDSAGAFKYEYNKEYYQMKQCREYHVPSNVDTRPSESEYPDDYCWVQPTVFNIRVNGRIGETIDVIDGAGNINLTWNVSLDAEQWPIKAIWVYWGDGEKDVFSWDPLGIAPRSNLNGPYHSATHEYKSPDCSADNPCKIRILVEDNWGFGNGYCVGGENDGKSCPSESFGLCDPNCWGTCRGGPNTLNSCQSKADCPGDGSYCSGVFDGQIVVQTL